MSQYRRSRKDYPKGVIGIYDTGPNKFADRYTVVYEPYIGGFPMELWYPVVTMSAAPFHPQGVCMHDSVRFRPTSSSWGNNGGCGRTIDFAELPEDCQRAVMLDLMTEDNANE